MFGEKVKFRLSDALAIGSLNFGPWSQLDVTNTLKLEIMGNFPIIFLP
jgi:hypothetical protein